MIKLPYMKSPCDNCPMRKDIAKGWLGSRRMKEILDSENFICHKTAYNLDHTKKKQCAGHLHLKKKESLFYRVAASLGIKIKINNSQVLHQDKKSCIQHHKTERHL